MRYIHTIILATILAFSYACQKDTGTTTTDEKNSRIISDEQRDFNRASHEALKTFEETGLKKLLENYDFTAADYKSANERIFIDIKKYVEDKNITGEQAISMIEDIHKKHMTPQMLECRSLIRKHRDQLNNTADNFLGKSDILRASYGNNK